MNSHGTVPMLVVALSAVWSLGFGSAPVSASEGSAMILREGSIAERQLVSLGRDLEVHGEARADVAALDGSVLVSGRVSGDVIVLGGGAHLDSTARVAGDVFTLGGAIETEPGAQIGGRSVAYPTASAAWLTLIEGPSLGLPATSPLVIGGKLALITSWLALVLVFFAAAGRNVMGTSQAIAEQPFRSFLVGVVGVLALVLTTLLFSAFAAALVGVPLLVLVVILALILKLWGMVAVFHALGAWLVRRRIRRPMRALNVATVGLIALGLIKFVPYLGIWAWSIATFIGVGAALSTKFGSRQPWLAPA
ncbi:MAG: polymer-forming cytoskeletal protein [Acidobacteriota bacterium]